MTGSYEIKLRCACNLRAVCLRCLTKTIFSIPQNEFTNYRGDIEYYVLMLKMCEQNVLKVSIFDFRGFDATGRSNYSGIPRSAGSHEEQYGVNEKNRCVHGRGSCYKIVMLGPY